MRRGISHPLSFAFTAPLTPCMELLIPMQTCMLHPPHAGAQGGPDGCDPSAAAAFSLPGSVSPGGAATAIGEHADLRGRDGEGEEDHVDGGGGGGGGDGAPFEGETFQEEEEAFEEELLPDSTDPDDDDDDGGNEVGHEAVRGGGALGAGTRNAAGSLACHSLA